MSIILGNEIIFIPLFGITVFIFAYFTSDRIIDSLARKSLGEREEVLQLMDKMFIDTDRTKVTRAMLAASFGSGTLMFFLVWPHFGLGITLFCAFTFAGWRLPAIIMYQLWEKRSTRLV